MVDKDFRGIFRDYKYDDDSETSHDEVKKRMQSEFNKHKFEDDEEKSYKEEIRDLREQIRDLREHVRESKEEEPKEKHKLKHIIKHVKPKPTFKFGHSKPGIEPSERIVLIGIIVLLVAFIVVDLAFFHECESTKTIEGPLGSVVVINETEENETAEEVVEEVEGEEEPECVEDSDCEEGEVCKNDACEEEELELSGVVQVKINKVYTNKVDEDMGHISRVTFTIYNGKNKVLKPTVDVYAYDNSLEDTWVDLSRGTFTYPVGIAPGDEQAGSVDLSPKTFVALNTIKTVVLKLSDEDGDVIASDQEKLYIK